MEVEHKGGDEVGVIAAACQLPGMSQDDWDIQGFWRVLNGKATAKAGAEEVLKPVPVERWTLVSRQEQRAESRDQAAPAVKGVKLPGGQPIAGLLKRPDVFDAPFFDLSETEVPWIDPHHRLVLMATAQALHKAGISRDAAKGKNIGVFVGVSNNEWGGEVCPEVPSRATQRPPAANLVSECFGLRGPSKTVNTSCASSISALEMALLYLKMGRCELAVVAGVHLLLSPRTHLERELLLVNTATAAATSPTQQPPQALSEGCGVIILQKLAGAEAEGRDVMAVVCGAATNYVGERHGEVDMDAQKALMRQVAEEAGLLKDKQVAYVELSGLLPCAGKGNNEVDCVGTVYRGSSSGCQGEEEVAAANMTPLLVGSAKPVVGHMDAASGIVGVLKALLILRHKQVPPQIAGLTNNHQAKGKKEDDGEEDNDSGSSSRKKQAAPATWCVPTKATPLKGGQEPLLVAVSNMALSGVCGHVILGEYRPSEEHQQQVRRASSTGSTGSTSGSCSSSDESPASPSSSSSSPPADGGSKKARLGGQPPKSTHEEIDTNGNLVLVLDDEDDDDEDDVVLVVEEEEGDKKEEAAAAVVPATIRKALVFKTRSYPWWAAAWQVEDPSSSSSSPDKDGDEEDGMSVDDQQQAVAGKDPKKRPAGKKRKREDSSDSSKEDHSGAGARRAAEIAKRRVELDKAKAEILAFLHNKAAGTATGGSGRRRSREEKNDLVEFLEVVKQRDVDKVKLWFECGYEAQSQGVLELIKWGEPKALQMAVARLPSDGRQTLFRDYTTNDTAAKALYQVLTLAGAGALHYAVLCDKPQLIRILLPKMLEQQTSLDGCRVPLKSYLFRDKEGLTPMHYAVRYGKVECLRELINAGSDQTHFDKMGNPPLLWTQPEHLECFEQMLACGADVNVEDKEKRTLLFWSVLAQQRSAHVDGVVEGGKAVGRARISPKEQHIMKKAAAWRALSSLIRSKGGDYGRRMAEECRKDMSLGLEAFPVPIVDIDQQEVAAGRRPLYPLFAYSTDSIGNPFTQGNGICCDCVGDCRGNQACACNNRFITSGPAFKPGSTQLTQSALNVRRPLFECAPGCRCWHPPDGGEACNLNITKGGALGVQVEVHWHQDKGFAVHAKKPVSMGSYVATYTGEYMKPAQAEQRWADAQAGLLKGYNPHYVVEVEIQAGRICIDGGYLGSVARLFNHSCDPNLKLMKISTSTLYPKVAFFAVRDIAEGDEFTFDYSPPSKKWGKKRDQEKSENPVECKCGSEKCRKYI